MAIPLSGGGGGNDAGFIPLLDFLRDKLGGYFFQREGMPVEDVAYVNLVRLRALFENTGQNDTLLKLTDRTQDDNVLTVHEAAFDTDSDRISGAVNALFGQPGRININLGGNAMPDGTDASVSVRNQWTDMQRLGDPETVTAQSSPVEFTNLAGPGDRDPRPSDLGSTTGGVPLPGPGDRDPRPGGLTSSLSGGDGGAGGTGGAGGGGDTWSTTDDTLPEDGTARQIPGGEELWNVDGKVYLAYKAPNSETWMVWHVENPERLEAIYGGDQRDYDRQMSQGQFEALSPWYGGLSAELQNTSEDPWTQFMSDYEQAAERRPWLNDPTMVATIAGAYLEGRDPTQDELAETDWWNEHTGEERAFMENAVTSGRAQLREQIREEARKWLGPEFGTMSAQQIDDWTKKVHEDPSLGDDLLDMLKRQNRALFSGYYDGDTERELTYEDITTPFRNLASNVWGQPFDDESMLVDLANTHDYTEAATRLRRTGLRRGVGKVVNDSLEGLGQTSLGDRVVRSAI